MIEREHVWRKDLQLKIELKQAAIEALPEELQGPAREPDLEPFPLDRWIATLTPPRAAQGTEQATQQSGRDKAGMLGIGIKRR